MNCSSTERLCKSIVVEAKLEPTSSKSDESSISKFACRFCPKTFTRKDIRIKHERIHTGEHPYTCNYCSKSFSQKAHKSEHERIHTGERPFSCNFCSKAFTRQSHKVMHERTHTGDRPYICNVCSKAFSRQSYKVMHERTHTGERPYICNFCSKAFTRQSYKVIHERSHTGERPYICNFCSKAFTRHSDKVRHELIHSRKSTSSSASIAPSTTHDSEGCDSTAAVSGAVSESVSTESLEEEKTKSKRCWIGLEVYMEESEDEVSNRCREGFENDDKPSLCKACYEGLYSKVV